jgi:hypothetical protein
VYLIETARCEQWLPRVEVEEMDDGCANLRRPCEKRVLTEGEDDRRAGREEHIYGYHA